MMKETSTRTIVRIMVIILGLVCLSSLAEHFHFEFEHAYEGPWDWDEITMAHTNETRDGVMYESYRGTAAVTGYNGSDSELSIPTQISHSWIVYDDDKQGNVTPVYEFDYRVDVVQIGSRAFSDKTDLVSITIPNSVTNIGVRSFSGCSGLTSVTIPVGVRSIGDYAFSGCSGLTSVTIPNSVTSIGNYPFNGCSAVRDLMLPGQYEARRLFDSSQTLHRNLTNAVIAAGSKIMTGTLLDCIGLRSVTIPNSVTNIGDYALYNCYGLTSITIPEGVTSIGNYALYNCYGLTSITIPEGVTSIGDYAFKGCYKQIYSTGHVYWKSIGLQTVSIPSSVTNIGCGAFQGDALLQSIVIPNGVTRLSADLFADCSQLSSITIPSTLSEIDDTAFKKCNLLAVTRINLLDVDAWATNAINSKLVGGRYLLVDGTEMTRYVIPDWTKVVEPYVFKGCIIDEIVVPDGTESIGDHAFEECLMSEFSLPNSVTNIGDYAFSGMGLRYLGSQPGPFVIPDSVVHLGDYAFSSWSFTDDLHIPIGLKTIGSGVFSNCGRANSFTIPQGVEVIGDHAFSGCDWCWKITIPNTVTNIGWFAFAENHSLSAISLPTGVTAIAASTFYDCTSLERISIPPSVTTIGQAAFYNCSSLESIEINPGLESIDYRAFYGCSGLTAVHISDLAAWLEISYDDETSNPLFYAHHLYLNGTEITDLAIPDGTTRIAKFVFAGGSNFQSIFIPDSVTSIDRCALSGCSGLRSIAIPNGVTNIGSSAFADCSGLTTVVIPTGTVDIARRTFYGCSSLDSIVIPYGVGTIGDYAFYGCSSLKELAIPASVTNIFIVDDAVFNGCDSLETISMPSRFREKITFPPNCEVFFYDPLVMRGNSMPSGSEGSPYSATIPTTGGGREIRWSVSSGALPDGLVLDSATGGISGSPSRQGTFSFQIAASDEFGQNAAQDFSIRIEAALQFLTNGRLPSATAGVPYGQPIEVVGGVQPLSYELVAPGSFPTWASRYDLTGNSHVLSGMPRNDDRGTFSFTLRVTDAQGAVVERTFSVDVCSPPLLFLTEETLPAAVAEGSYWQVLTATGGVEPYAWEIVDLNGWPNWLSSNSVGGGYLQGWPSEYDIGIYSFTLRVTDAEGTSSEKTFSIEVQEDPNHAPVIESWTPEASRFRLDPGATTNLSVVASDPDGDGLTYSWTVYDEDWNWLENGDSTSASYTFSRAIGEEGTNIVEVYVSDGQFTDCHSWTVMVAEKTPLAIVTDATLPVALTEENYWQPMTASGGEEPYTWELVDPDDWPAWLDRDYIDYWNDWGYDCPYLSSSWNASEDDIGIYTFALRVTDAEGTSVEKTFTLEVQDNPNHRPAIESWTPEASRFRLDPGATTNLSVVASDPDGDALTYSWIIYDEDWNWLENGDSTSASYTFSRAVGEEGTNIVEVCVSDGQFTDRHSWTVVVAEKTPLAIVTDATLPIALTEEGYWQPVTASGGEEPYTWEIVDPDDWPAWLSADYIDYWDDWGYECPYLASNWYPSEDDIGTCTFALRVTDAEGSNVVKTFTLEVQENPNPPPVIDSYSPDGDRIHVEPGTTQTFSVEAHDPKGDPISFYWYVYDPDDNRLYRSESGGETNEFSWTFDAAVTGTYEVSVEVADGSHSSYCYWYVAASIPKTIYVDQASTADDPDGTSWETAYPTLGDALDDIEIDDTVLVAPGNYFCPWLPDGIELRSRDGAATTFLGSVYGDGGLRIEGFTFQGLRYSPGPSPMPFSIVPDGSELVGCVVSGCSSDGDLLDGCKLENCIVADCEAARDLISGCDLENCAVVGNTSGYDILSDCRLWNCTVAGNTLLSWYSAVNQSCSAWNSVLWGNYGIDDAESEWRWPESVSYGFWWDDETGDYTDLHMTELHDCCVEGIWNIALTLQNDYGVDYDPDALGLLEEPPDFVDLAHGDVRLRTGSPCLDAGAAAWVRGTTDVAGNARVQGAAVDLGACEGAVDGFVLSVRVVGTGTVSPMTAVVPAGGSATFTASESAGRPFRGWTVGGADAGTAATYTWSDVQADGELVATFGSFSFCVDAATGGDANDGLSWAAPKATIQAAVEAAVDGEGVLVKPGVYGPIDTAGKAVRIESTDGKAATVIDGGGTNRCAYLGTGVGHGAKLAGFALRNGNAAWDASPKAGMGGGAHGGTLLDCDITGCRAYENGGGLACSEAHRCAIVGNGIFDGDDWAYGGGAYKSDLYSCLVASNVIVLSISPDDPTPTATAYGGGAAWGALYQCTVADNSIQSDDLATGGGWYADWGELNGSIFYGNTANGAASDVENWEGSVSFEQSLVGVDPLFVDRANGDYRLRQDSPAVDAGFSSTYEWRGPPSEAIEDLDLDGNPRVRGLCIDLGCYESGYAATDKATSTTPEPVPYAWLNENATNAVKGAWGGYEEAAKKTAANGRPVWECYVADLDPEDEDDDLVADIEMVDGRPVVTILKGEKAGRDYETQGAPAPGGPWGTPDENSRFFRVKVSLP